VFELLRACGKNPSVISGAPLRSLEDEAMIGNAFYGGPELLVIEADESDGTCTKYAPAVTVLLNISKDHKPVEETLGLFSALADNSGFVIANADDARLRPVRRSMSFGIKEKADFTAERIDYTPLSTVVYRNGFRFELPIPGRHNASNLLASLSVCALLGCDDASCAAAVKKFKGVKRRFSVTSLENGMHVVDDYAHNPDKIAAAISAARQISPRIIALFQPHGFGPLRFFQDELVEVFARALGRGDILVLLPVYYAGGTAQKDISSEIVAKRLHSCAFEVYTPSGREEAIGLLRRKAFPGDCVISMGARDPSLEQFARDICAALS
jgi:UDP-N-acetylmuramate--alanine ligase